MLLRELFDRPVEYSRNRNEYRFSIEGINYRFKYFLRLSNRAISVQFCELERDSDRNCTYDITNSGNHIKVFSTVVSIMREVMEEISPIIVHFTAEEESRKKLYLRMVKSLIPSWKLYTRRDEDGMLVFSVVDPRITKEELVRLVISDISSITLQLLPKEFYTYDLCLEIIRQFGTSYFELIPTPAEKLDDGWPEKYKRLCMDLVSNSGSRLRFIPIEYRDYDICLAAARDDAASVFHFGYIPRMLIDRVRNQLDNDR